MAVVMPLQSAGRSQRTRHRPCAYKIMAGLMRLVCLNRIVVSDRELSSVTIKHKDDVASQLIEGSFEVLGESRKAVEAADTWAGVTLSRDEQAVMAEAAHPT